MSWFGNAMEAVLSGGVTGIFGAGLQKIGELVQMKMQHKHEKEMRELDMTSMKLEGELALSKATQESEAQQALAQQASFDKSFDADRATYVQGPVTGWMQAILVAVDGVRGFVRPILTLWFVFILMRIYFQLNDLTKGLTAFDPQLLLSMFSDVVNGLLYIGSTVILWWFGVRSQQKQGK